MIPTQMLPTLPPNQPLDGESLVTKIARVSFLLTMTTDLQELSYLRLSEPGSKLTKTRWRDYLPMLFPPLRRQNEKFQSSQT